MKQTKRDIVNEIFKLTEDEQVRRKLQDNYWFRYKFLGLDYNFNELKYSMAVNLNKFKKIEYILVLQEVKKALV